MSEGGYRVYENIIEATNSELILFFIIVAVIVLPLYVAVLKGRKAEKQHEREREKQILEVIKENSTVIAGLKVTLDTSKIDTKDTLTRIHNRIDDISSNVAQLNTKVDNTIASQVEIASKVNKTLLIVGATPPKGGEN